MPRSRSPRRRTPAPTTCTSATPPGPCSTTARGPALASPGIVVDTGCPGANQLIGIRVDAGTALRERRDRRHHLHEPRRHRDHRLHADPPARLQEPGRLAARGRSSRSTSSARRLRGRGRLRRRHPHPAQRPAQLVRLPGERGPPREGERHDARRFPALAAYRNDARTLIVRAGCFKPQHGAVRGRPRRADLQRRLRRQGDRLRPDAARVLLRRGVRPARRRPARRLGPGDGLRRRQRRHRARRDRRRHRPGRAARRRLGELRRRLHLRGRRAAHRRRRHVLVRGSPSPARTSPARRVRPSSLQVGRRNLLVRFVDAGRQLRRPRAVPGRRRHPVRPRRRQRHRRQGAGPRHRALLEDQEAAHDRPLRPQGRRPRAADQRRRQPDRAARSCGCSRATCARAPTRSTAAACAPAPTARSA